MAKRKTLEQWIAEVIVDPDKEKFSGFSLVHMQGTSQKEIHSYKWGGTGEIDAKHMASVFRGKAEAYCQDMPGVQQFQMLAFYSGKNEPEAFQPFTVNVQSDHSGLATEGPSEQGQIQQRMRHNEALIQQTYRKQEHLDNYTLRLLDAADRRNAALAHENMEAFNIVKEMLMERALNEHTRTMEQLAFSRATEERKKWLSFAPLLINTLLGDNIFPQSTEDTALIEGLANAVTEEHIHKLMGLGLPNELMGPLAARVMKAREKKAKEEAATKQLPAYRGNVEDDVTGGAE